MMSIPVPSVSAQSLADLREAIRVIARDSNRIEVIQAFNFFSSTPGISGSYYEFSDEGLESGPARTNLVKVPGSYEFGNCGFVPDAGPSDRNAPDPEPARSTERAREPRCIKPYVEIGLTYARSTQDGQPALVFPDTDINFDLTTFAAQTGLGVSFPLSKTLTFRPIFLLGYSYVEEDADVEGEFVDELREVAGGILFDFEAESLLFGPAAEFEYRAAIDDDFDVESTLRYDHVFDYVLDASDEVLEGTNDFGIWTANVKGTKATGIELYSRELSLIGTFGGSYFPGDLGDKLLADYYLEGGGGVEIAADGIIKGLQGVELSGLYIWGPDVTGYKFGLSVNF